jgi:hypothetical protein
MPYISRKRRRELAGTFRALQSAKLKADGDLNYLLFKLCKESVEPSYHNLKNFCGELRQCATEIERRLLGPYEDQKILENGDV